MMPPEFGYSVSPGRPPQKRNITGAGRLNRRRIVLYVGQPDAHPFVDTWRFLRQHTSLQLVSTVGDAVRNIAQAGIVPDLCVITQSYPQPCPSEHLDALRKQAPLARIVVLCGVWCEGSGRTGRPWPGTIRLYWHQLPGRLSAAWLAGHPDPYWSQPATSSDAEQFLLLSSPRPPVVSQPIAIAAGSKSSYDALAELCQQAGYLTTWFHPRFASDPTEVGCGIWDDSSQGAVTACDFQRHIHPAPTILLVGFPRRASDRAVMAKADHQRGPSSVDSESLPVVLGKPFFCRDLLFTLERLNAPAPTQLATRAA